LPDKQGLLNSFLHNDGNGNWSWSKIDYSYLVGVQAAATFLAGPVSGAAAVPTFRGIVATDIIPNAAGALTNDGGGNLSWAAGGMVDAPNSAVFYGRRTQEWQIPLIDDIFKNGSDVIINGNFGTDSDWTKGNGWTIDIGTSRAVATAVTAGALVATVPPLAGGGKIYIVQYYVEVTSGDVCIFDGDSEGLYVTVTGQYNEIFTSDDGSFGFHSPSGSFTGTIRFVSAKLTNTLTTELATKITSPADAAGALTNDGAGALSWAAAGGGALTATYVGFGDAGNVLTGSANLTWRDATFPNLNIGVGLAIGSEAAAGMPYVSFFDNALFFGFDSLGTSIGLNGNDIVLSPAATGTVGIFDAVSSQYAYFDTSDIASSRTYTFPDASGTLALVGDAPTAHTIDGASHTGTGSTLDVVGFSAANTLGVLTPSADVRNGTSAILKSASGDLKLGSLYVTRNTDISNTFIGNAGNATASSINNTGIGDYALASLTSGQRNFAVGYASMFKLEDGNNNFGLGGQALEQNVSGSSNVAIGNYALRYVTYDGNVAIGYYAGYGNAGAYAGQENVFIGQFAGRYAQNSFNVLIGSSAGTLNTGAYNVMIGAYAGATSADKYYNVFLGYNAGYYETGDYKLFIDCFPRASEADGRIKALVYGVFNAAVANQYLTVNGILTVNGDEYLPADSRKLWFGAGDDMTIYYDGTSGYIKTSDVAASDLHITTGAAKTLVLDTPVYNDWFVAAHSLHAGATPPTWAAWNGTLYAPEFINAATTDLHGSFELLHEYKEGTDIEIHIHWSPSTTNNGNCKWGLDYTVQNIDGTFASPTTITITPAASGVVRKHSLTTFGAISGAGLTIGAIIDYRIYRLGNDGADTFTGSAFLHNVGCHHECDTIGSRQQTIK
jgi:hypothetical protein